MEIKLLETDGIVINVNNEVKKVFFALTLITGDNLGLNSILGMVESFRANYFCQLCRIHRDDTEICINETLDQIRTEKNYEVDLRKNDTYSTGIKERCLWNDLQSFHITRNIYGDIMHDIIEGVGDYDMALIISKIINMKWVTYNELNELVQCFYYGDQEFGNKPPLITRQHVSEETLKFSASEMLCLIRYFPLILGHKVIANDPVWQFFLCLREIVDLLFASTFAVSDISRLNEMIAEHHSRYLVLSNRKLRPKYHKMIHYGRIIKAVGPLKPLWSMRSEAKYKEYRQAANVTSCRKDIAYTLAIKQSLKMCTRFLCRKGLVNKFEFSPFYEIISVKDLNDYDNFSHKLPPSEIDVEWHVVKWAKVNGILYKPGMIVVVGLDDFFPRFGVINVISIKGNHDVRFLLKELVTLSFKNYLYSYHVRDDELWDCWSFVNYTNLITFLPAHLRLFYDGEKYVMLRQPV